MKKSNLIFAISIVAALTACSKKPGDVPASEAVTQSAKEEKTPAVTREMLLSSDKYIPVTMGQVSGDAQLAVQNANMRALFWNGAPLDYEALADDFVPEYKEETDSFKRADLAKANKLPLEAAYRTARINNHFAIKFEKQLGSIKKYDATTRGFHVWPMDLSDNMSYYWNRPKGKAGNYSGFWGIRLLGADSFDYIPASEEEARRIEGALAERRGGSDTYNSAIIVYGRVVGYVKDEFNEDKLRKTALLLVDGMSFVDPKTNEVLFTVNKSMLPKEVKFDSKITPDYFAAASAPH
jgi:hypothetical protein